MRSASGRTCCCLHALGFLWTLAAVMSSDVQGPRFTVEPPSRLEFLNGTGGTASCAASGDPSPEVRWIHSDGRPLLPKVTRPGSTGPLREVRPDGTLYFRPFGVTEFTPDVHDAVYRCLAINPAGTIASRQMVVRTALQRSYEVRVSDQSAIYGTTAVLRCHISSGDQEFIEIVSWIVDDKLLLSPDEDFNAGEKFRVLPSGELYIHEVSEEDGKRSFKCRTRHRLSGQEKASAQPARIILADPQDVLGAKLTHNLPKVMVSRGETAVLPCAAQGKPYPVYTWSKLDKGRPRPLKRNARIQQVQGVLIVRKAGPDDSGLYSCSVNNSHGKDSTTTELVVSAPLEVMVEPHLLVVLTGGSATLTCSVQGYPVDSVQWSKDAAPVEATSTARVQLLAPHILHINALWREDQGMYQCLVFSGTQSRQAAAQITVADVGPVIHERFPERTVEPSGMVTLRCVVSGHPLPNIQWSVDGYPVRDTDRIRSDHFVTSDGRLVAYLNVTQARTEDGGRYRCLARNSVGSADHSARINVFGAPFVRPMANVTVVEGQTLVLTCPYGGYPIETVVWERGGLQLPVTSRQRVSTKNGTLEINDVQRDYDEGYYTCAVRNQEGAGDQQKVAVLVTTPPKILPFEVPPRIRQGTTAVLTCTVNQGDPPFDIRWLKNGRSFSADLGVSIKVHEMYSILHFSSLRRHHAGNYTCLVSNNGGVASHSAILKVDVPPRWTQEPQNASVVVGHSVSLECGADGSPTPTITWKKAQGSGPRDFSPLYNGYHHVLYGNGSLLVRDADPTTAGLYLCEATNQVGPGLSKLVAINVHAPPVIERSEGPRTAQLGASYLLECTAKGDTPLDVTWLKGETVLQEGINTRYKIGTVQSEQQVKSTLSSTQATRNDTGSFLCRVRNAYGLAEAKVELLVQEAPSVPTALKLTDAQSRTLILTWDEPFDGHSPLTGYQVHYTLEGTENWLNISVDGSSPTSQLRDLVPASQYVLQVSAENALGRGPLSQPLHVSTQEEAPDGPPLSVRAVPTGPNSIKVSWKPPQMELWNGVVRGYYIGYQSTSAPPEEPAMFKTVEVRSSDKNDSEVHLTNLRRSTEYAVFVQAFNGKGSGPKTEEVIVKTLDDVPPTVPTLQLVSTTSNSITVKWDYNRPFGSSAIECVLYLRREHGEWQGTKVNNGNGTHTVGELSCGSRYQFYMVSFNSVGRSEPSTTLTVRTNGAAPLSPTREDFLQPDTTSVLMNLLAWQTGGCPIGRFAIRWRRRQRSYWTTVSESVPPSQKQYLLQGLSPAQWYDLQITAYSSAGATEALYEFSTLNVSEEVRVTEPALSSEQSSAGLLDLSVLVPVISSSAIIVIIVLVGCLMCHKKSPGSNSGQQEDPYRNPSACKGSFVMESVVMKEMEAPHSDDGTHRSSSSAASNSRNLSQTGSRETEHPYSNPYDTLPPDEGEGPLGLQGQGRHSLTRTRILIEKRPSEDNFYASSRQHFRPGDVASYEALKPTRSASAASYSVFEPVPCRRR